MAAHIAFECDCHQTGCQFCDGGLEACTVCHAFEGAWTTDCPGYSVSMDIWKVIYETGMFDFIDGDWLPVINQWSPTGFKQRIEDSRSSKSH